MAAFFAAEPVSAQESSRPTGVGIYRTSAGARVYWYRSDVSYYQVLIWTSYQTSCSASNPTYTSGQVYLAASTVYKSLDVTNSALASASFFFVCVRPQINSAYSSTYAGSDDWIYYTGVSISPSGSTATVAWTTGASSNWRVYIWTSLKTSPCSTLTGYQHYSQIVRSSSAKTFAWTNSAVATSDHLTACLVPYVGSSYMTTYARRVTWTYLCNPTDYPSTSMGLPLDITSGETRTVTGVITATDATRQCKDGARKRSSYFTLEIPANAGGGVRVTAVKGHSDMYPEILVRQGEDQYAANAKFWDTRTTQDDADAPGLVTGASTYTVQIRARDTTGPGRGGAFTLKVEPIQPAFLRFSYQNGTLHGYWDARMEDGYSHDSGMARVCYWSLLQQLSLQYFDDQLDGQYKLNDGSWVCLAIHGPAHHLTARVQP